eukprot:symbB.v1.2.021153.t1/scaffold1776.1/size101794/4
MITATLGLDGRFLSLEGLDLTAGQPQQKARPLLLLLALLPLLLGMASRTLGGEAKLLKWSFVALAVGFSLLPSHAPWRAPAPCWAHPEAGSLSALAVGHALLLHLELATVPLLAAAVSACCNETKGFLNLRRRASATAVVAVVFLADRLNKHMIHSPGRWTCAGCNALAALLCLNFPAAKRPRLSEWAEGYAGLRMKALQGAGRHRSLSTPELPMSVVGGLRRWSARLLKPPMEEPQEAHDPGFWNCLLQELWPSLRGMIEEDILKGEVQSVLQENVTAALKFDSAFLGTEPPKVHHLRMVSTHRLERSIILVMDTEFVGKDVNLTLKLTLGSFMGLSLGVTRLSLRGTLFLAFRHLTPHLPLTQARCPFCQNGRAGL